MSLKLCHENLNVLKPFYQIDISCNNIVKILCIG